jgi:hypothetical protein
MSFLPLVSFILPLVPFPLLFSFTFTSFSFSFLPYLFLYFHRLPLVTLARSIFLLFASFFLPFLSLLGWGASTYKHTCIHTYINFLKKNFVIFFCNSHFYLFYCYYCTTDNIHFKLYICFGVMINYNYMLVNFGYKNY